MLSTFLSGFSQGLERSLSHGLKQRADWLGERQSLLDQAQNARTRRRLAVRSARLRKRSLEGEDRMRVDAVQARAASSGLRLNASSKAGLVLAETSRRARKTAQASSVLKEALADRLSRAALHRHGRA